MNIDKMTENEYYVVTNCDVMRLLEHGFIPGTKIQIYKKIPGMISVFIRGTIIALREDEFKKISIGVI